MEEALTCRYASRKLFDSYDSPQWSAVDFEAIQVCHRDLRTLWLAKRYEAIA